MKHHIRTLACGAALIAAIVVIACGGKQTMASKSAAAFDEANKKGIAIEASEHGGHAAEAAGGHAAAATEANHKAMPGMDHGAIAGMDHSQMSGMDHSAMAGMDHSKMPGMRHGASGAGAHDMAAIDHAAMPGMARGAMTGMQHGSPTAVPMIIEPPTSNSAIAQMQPAAALRPDELDAPAPAAVQEAAKAASGMSHPMETAPPNAPTPPQHEHPPQPQPPSEHHHHGSGERP